MRTEASDSELVEASSSGLLFAGSGSPPLASALEWPSGNEGISRAVATSPWQMICGMEQPSQQMRVPLCHTCGPGPAENRAACRTPIGCLQHWRRRAAHVKYLYLTYACGQMCNRAACLPLLACGLC